MSSISRVFLLRPRAVLIALVAAATLGLIGGTVYAVGKQELPPRATLPVVFNTSLRCNVQPCAAVELHQLAPVVVARLIVPTSADYLLTASLRIQSFGAISADQHLACWFQRDGSVLAPGEDPNSIDGYTMDGVLPSASGDVASGQFGSTGLSLSDVVTMREESHELDLVCDIWGPTTTSAPVEVEGASFTAMPLRKINSE